MDAVQQFADKLNIPVPKTFLVGGASKVGQIFVLLSCANRILIFLKF
jgi:hypothetical protein